ncbi:MAG: type II secretion system F family protein [Armatimonadetes bacterium]|nr:type II secretion system F family protein [Armatimonadota bacterium]
MPRYSYKAQLGNGESVSEIAESASLPALAARLAGGGAKLETAKELNDPIPKLRGIPYFEIVGIYRQLASALAAGLPVVQTFEMLSNETNNVRIKKLLHFLRSQVSQGMQLSEAMRLLPKIFPNVHTAAIKAGEESGHLEKVIADLADQAEAMSNMSRRFASALVYPSVIATFALGLFTFSIFNFVPRFLMMFNDLGIRDLPMITQVAIFLSNKILPVVFFTALGILILSSIVLTQRKATSGKLWVDSWKLKIPLLGQIVEKAALARFAGSLGVLLDAGIDLPRAMRLASEGVGNCTVEYLLKNVSTEIELGHTLSEAINKTDTLSPTLAWRMGVGEETGSLSESLLGMSRLYSQQVESLVTSVAAMIEPLLIIFIGTGVAMLVLGMFLPLIAVIQNLSGGG